MAPKGATHRCRPGRDENQVRAINWGFIGPSLAETSIENGAFWLGVFGASWTNGAIRHGWFQPGNHRKGSYTPRNISYSVVDLIFDVTLQLQKSAYINSVRSLPNLVT
ncbi:hypothetical protein VTN49DRAFT_1438 [Thermomyces lanuginosus]|uniref:uncharacterized protein n=1 Tax=Thermomyces lanuginosus TaxID=5541 RepID=UPI00374476DF